MTETTGDNKEKPTGNKKPDRHVPREMTPTRMENIALHYLDRFATSAENLRRVLTRRVQKAAYHHETDMDECAAWIDALIERYRQCNLLDDDAYARAQATSQNRRGKSLRAIRAMLKAKGVPTSSINTAVEGLSEDRSDPDLDAAIAYARRRRIGPHRTRDTDQKGREKELAALARAGFSYAIARKVVAADTVEDIDQDV